MSSKALLVAALIGSLIGTEQAIAEAAPPKFEPQNNLIAGFVFNGTNRPVDSTCVTLPNHWEWNNTGPFFAIKRADKPGDCNHGGGYRDNLQGWFNRSQSRDNREFCASFNGGGIQCGMMTIPLRKSD